MEEKKIVIDINEEGSLHAETFGMEGTECIEELDKLMKDLVRQNNYTKKPEYYKNSITSDNTVKIKR